MSETVERDLGEIKGKLDLVIENQKAHATQQSTFNLGIDGRVRAVENRQWWVAGFGAALGAVASHLGIKWTTA